MIARSNVDPSATDPTWLVKGRSIEAPDAAPRPLPARVGRYDVAGMLGRGGAGVVLLARDPALGREVAIKTLRDHLDSEELERRFVAEFQVTSQLEHPNIVPVHDLGMTDEGRPFACMKRIKGESLAERLARIGRIPDGLARERANLLRDFLKICDGVALAHARGVVHRDLKPANVMVGEFGEVLVVDWGLAKVASAPTATPLGVPARDAVHVTSDPVATLAGAIVGTPAFMAPEQVDGDAARIGPATDVHALGGILYAMLTGTAPFQGSDVVGVLASVSSGQVEPPSRRAAGHGGRVPRELDCVVLHAMAHAPTNRYPDALTLKADVEAWLDDRPVSVARYGPFERALKWCRRHRGATAAAAIGALAIMVLVSIAAVLLDRARRDAEELARRERAAREIIERRARVDGDLVATRRLLRVAESLWPAVPSRLAALVAWQDEAAALVAAGRERPAGARLDGEPGTGAPPDTSLGADNVQELREGLVLLERALPDLARRIALARELAHASGAWDEAWTTAIADVARPDGPYGGLALARQGGLVPLGRDPASGLLELAHVPSGEVPARGADGALATTGATAIVLVLVPGGKARVGSDPGDLPSTIEPNADEAPRHEVSLAPYMIAKHELTRGQWARLVARLGDAYAIEGDAALPLVGESWDTLCGVLRKYGLDLPTEAQWEHAARGRTDTGWWPHAEAVALRERAANLADYRYAIDLQVRERRGDAVVARPFEAWMDDEHAGLAPVGTYIANPFGLFDVIGNAREWCRDYYGPYTLAVTARDGEREVGSRGRIHRVVRDGSYLDLANDARAARRHFAPAGFSEVDLGARAARALEGERRD